VPDGETAASYLRFYQYEVAVLDWRMPRLSGSPAWTREPTITW
jgi:DNA-binding response OmpR family regulator